MDANKTEEEEKEWSHPQITQIGADYLRGFLESG